MVERKTINQTICYLFDYGIMANFISKLFVEKLYPISLCKYNGPVKNLDNKPMTTNSSLVCYLQYDI